MKFRFICCSRTQSFELKVGYRGKVWVTHVLPFPYVPQHPNDIGDLPPNYVPPDDDDDYDDELLTF